MDPIPHSEGGRQTGHLLFLGTKTREADRASPPPLDKHEPRLRKDSSDPFWAVLKTAPPPTAKPPRSDAQEGSQSSWTLGNGRAQSHPRAILILKKISKTNFTSLERRTAKRGLGESGSVGVKKMDPYSGFFIMQTTLSVPLHQRIIFQNNCNFFILRPCKSVRSNFEMVAVSAAFPAKPIPNNDLFRATAILRPVRLQALPSPQKKISFGSLFGIAIVEAGCLHHRVTNVWKGHSSG